MFEDIEITRILYCNKYLIRTSKEKCSKCFEAGNSGFANIITCMNFNITFIEEKENEKDKIY